MNKIREEKREEKMSSGQSKSKAIDHKFKVLDIIASKIGIKYVKIEERQDINSDTLEFAIMGSGYLTSYDISFLTTRF